MVSLRLAAGLFIAVLATTAGLFGLSDAASPAQDSSPPAKSLFFQSAVLVLEREFSSNVISYLLLYARSGALFSSRYDDPAWPIPLGLLLKPFTAVYYGVIHAYHFP